MSHLTKVANGLIRFKAMATTPDNLPDRHRAIQQLMIDLTNFENVPPCLVIDPEECSLAVEVFE
jgi:hypothetical protein